MKDVHNFYWLIGILEGEGSFLRPSPSKPREPKIDLEMKDRDAIERVAALLGLSYRTRIRNKPNTSPTFHVRLSGKRAVQLMWRILPYMTARRQQQIEAAIKTFSERGPEYDPSNLPKFAFKPVCIVPMCPRAPKDDMPLCSVHC